MCVGRRWPGTSVRPVWGVAGTKDARLLKLFALFVEHIGVLAQGRTLTHHIPLQRFPLLELDAQRLSLSSDLGRLRIELLLPDAIEVDWPLSTLS